MIRSSSIFDPERWNFDRKKSTTPTENGPRNADPADHRVNIEKRRKFEKKIFCQI